MSKRRREIPRGQIGWLVDRHHVSASNLAIIRDLRGRMRGENWTKPNRKAAYRYAIKRHEENRELYRDVMRGAF